MSVQVGDILRIVAAMVWDDAEVAQNVYNAVIGGSGGPYDDADIVDDALAWVQAMYANWLTHFSDELNGSQVQVYKYDSVDDDFDEVGTVGWSFTPTGAADQLPRGVAGLVTCRTSDPDVQGKKYLPGLTEAAALDGIITVGTLAVMLDYADDWVTAFVGGVSGASWIPGIWSPTRTNFFPCGDSYTANAIPAYQRRRKQGVGV